MVTGAATPDHGPVVTDLLRAEHAQVARTLHHLTQTKSTDKLRQELEALVRTLAKHEAAEEMAVYPVLAHREAAAECCEIALAQEHATKKLLNAILRRSFWRPGSRGLRKMVASLADQVNEHAKFEENFVFVLLEDGEDEQKLQMMGTWVANAELIAPARPHPHGSQHLPGLAVANPVLATTDRLRNFVRRRLAHY